MTDHGASTAEQRGLIWIGAGIVALAAAGHLGAAAAAVAVLAGNDVTLGELGSLG